MSSERGRRSIEHLAATWASIGALCSDLTDEQWALATGCPGWSVQDHVSHLVDFESVALGRPRPPADVSGLAHLANALGEDNEIGVAARRSRTGREVLDELVEVTGSRLAQLRALDDADFDREVATTAGPGVLSDLLTLRVMDSWSHEQDLRRALGRPGHGVGGPAEESVGYFCRILPAIIGKRVRPPDGTTIVVDVDGVAALRIAVSGGRAAAVDEIAEPAPVTLAMSAPTLAAIVGGRSDAPDDVVVQGDAELAEAVLAALPFLP